ncbi:nucleotidyltransferase family protein [Planctomycetota bacterium]
MGSDMVKNKDGVLKLLENNETRLHELGVNRIALFGSFVRNEQRPDSDIDIMVEFRAGCKNFDNFMELALFLEELMGREVELVTVESISPRLKPYILDEIEYAPLSN